MIEEEVMPELGTASKFQDDCIKEYIPSRSEALRDHRIEIEFLSIGCLIKIGCKSIPFSTVKQGMEALNQYVNDPVSLRKLWMKRFLQEEEL
jgi:hypothetical protein